MEQQVADTLIALEETARATGALAWLAFIMAMLVGSRSKRSENK